MDYMMMKYINALPAYGANYANQKECKAAWNSGKDMRSSATGQYLNNETAKRYNLKVIVTFPNRSGQMSYCQVN